MSAAISAGAGEPTFAAGMRRRQAREHRQAERAAHHERGVDDSRGESRLALVDIAHRRQQQGVEGDSGAEAEQQHAGQHVDSEAAVDRRAREQGQAERGAEQAATSGPLRPKRMTMRAERPSEHDAMIRFDGRKARPTCIAL